MQREEGTDTLFETIKRELALIIAEGSENCEIETKVERKSSQDCDNTSEICSASVSNVKKTVSYEDDISSISAVLEPCHISNINDDIKKMQNNLDESCNTFQVISEIFESIDFGCLKNRIEDLHLNGRSTDPMEIIINDLKHFFDEKFKENRLAELTKEVTSKFRNHPGEFGDIPEISDFFRACSKLEHGMEKLRQQRYDCLYLQKRMTRVVEASYDRVNVIQKKVVGEGEEQQGGK